MTFKARPWKRYWWECVAPGVGVVAMTNYGIPHAVAFFSSVRGSPAPAMAFAEDRVRQYNEGKRKRYSKRLLDKMEDEKEGNG